MINPLLLQVISGLFVATTATSPDFLLVHNVGLEPPLCTGTVIDEPVYDFDTDDSFQKYVGPKTSLQVVTYRPKDLVDIQNSQYIEVRNNQGQLRKEANSYLEKMAQEFYNTFHKPLVVVSSYRGYEYQKKLFSGYVETMGYRRAASLSALPGRSEHQLGLAIDVFSASTANEFKTGYKSYGDWLSKNAHFYGWTQSYQKGQQIDGYAIEPWHWRYVGKEIATYLSENHMTFTEFVELKKIWSKSLH